VEKSIPEVGGALSEQFGFALSLDSVSGFSP
jgi:hypothetical protein